MEIQSHNSVAVLAFTPDIGLPRLTHALVEELREHLNAVRDAGCFRAVVIGANSESFAIGADLEELPALDGVTARQFAERGQTVFSEIESFPLPVVAAIRGYCLGGGLDLALACRGRVATYNASLGHPGVTLGLITGWGGTQSLPRLLGKAAALQLLLTGERIPATQALTLGLVDELVPSQDLLEASARRASAFALSAL